MTGRPQRVIVAPGSYDHRRLTTALAHAYNVIEMCAPAAPPIRLPNPNPNPNPGTHPNPNSIFNPNPNLF